MATHKNPAASFEDNLKSLEALVDRLESGDLPLEEALKAFEEGVKLTRACNEALTRAELKVQQLKASELLDEESPDNAP